MSNFGYIASTISHSNFADNSKSVGGVSNLLLDGVCRGLPANIKTDKGFHISQYINELESIGIIKKATDNVFQTDSLLYFPVFNEAQYNKNPLISPAKIRDINTEIPSNTQGTIHPVLNFLDQPGIEHSNNKIKIVNPSNLSNNTVELLPLGPNKESILDWDGFFISFYLPEGSPNGTYIRINHGAEKHHTVFSVEPEPTFYESNSDLWESSKGLGPNEFAKNPLSVRNSLGAITVMEESHISTPQVKKLPSGSEAGYDHVTVPSYGPGLYLIYYKYAHILDPENLHDGNIVSQSTLKVDRVELPKSDVKFINWVKPMVATYFLKPTGNVGKKNLQTIASTSFKSDYPIRVTKGFWQDIFTKPRFPNDEWAITIPSKIKGLASAFKYSHVPWLTNFGTNIRKRYSNPEEYENLINFFNSLKGKTLAEIEQAFLEKDLLNPVKVVNSSLGLVEKGIKLLAPGHRSKTDSDAFISSFTTSEILNFYNGKNNQDLFVKTVEALEDLRLSISPPTKKDWLPYRRLLDNTEWAYMGSGSFTDSIWQREATRENVQSKNWDFGSKFIIVKNNFSGVLNQYKYPGGSTFSTGINLPYDALDLGKPQYKEDYYSQFGTYKDFLGDLIFKPKEAKANNVLSIDDLLTRNGAGRVMFFPKEKLPALYYFANKGRDDYYRLAKDWDGLLGSARYFPDVSTKVTFFSDGANISKNSYQFMGVGTGLKNEQDIKRFMRATMDLIYKLT